VLDSGVSGEQALNAVALHALAAAVNQADFPEALLDRRFTARGARRFRATPARGVESGCSAKGLRGVTRFVSESVSLTRSTAFQARAKGVRSDATWGDTCWKLLLK
jgi:hypothetical protein